MHRSAKFAPAPRLKRCDYWVESLVVHATIHVLEAQDWPPAHDRPRWEAEARRVLGDAADRFTPSMRQKIDFSLLYRRALLATPGSIAGQPPLPVRAEWPFAGIDELFAEP